MVSAHKESKSRYGIANFEKRKHPRFLLNLPIEYNLSSLDDISSGCTVNASEGGLMVYLPEEVEVNQLLRVRLFLPSLPSMSTVEMLCEVMWANGLEKDRGYACGLKFVDVPLEEMNKLKGFLKDLCYFSN